MSASFLRIAGIGGEVTEFEWMRHCRFFRRSRLIYKSGTLNLRNSQTGSSSCQCSTTLIGQGRETMRFVFEIQKKSRFSRRNSRKDIGRSSVLEMKRSGLEKAKYPPEGKWDSVASQMVQRFKETGHPVFTSMRILQTQNSRSESFIL